MPQDNTLLTAPQYSAERCQQITVKGQCVNYAMKGHPFCAKHGQALSKSASKKAIADLYKCKFTEEIKNFSGSGYKSLAAEVGILRVVLQSILNSCTSPNELMMNAGAISDITSKLGNLVSQVDRIDMNSGNLLGEEDITQIANEIVYAISQRINDTEVLKALAQDINRIIMSKFEQVPDIDLSEDN